MEGIDYCFRINPNTKNIICDFDKCFILPYNYPKGNCTEFKYWCVTYHPNDAFYPVEQTTGARNDMIIEGAVPTYTNALLYKMFLEKALSTLDAENILQENLFVILYSVEIISLSPLMSILHLSINFTMRLLAGKYTLFLLMNCLASLWAGPLIVCTPPCLN